jgi:hypothetical protein
MYDPSAFIKSLDVICDELFVERSEEARSIISGAYFQYLNGAKLSIGNKIAFNFEEMRRKYQVGLKGIFKTVSKENETIAALVHSNYKNLLTYDKLRTEMMLNWSKICVERG